MQTNNKFKVISFDLDNTLYDNQPVLARAERKMNEYLSHSFKEQGYDYNVDLFQELKKKRINQGETRYENFNFLRQTVLAEICQHLNHAEKISEQAFTIFSQARSEVVIHSEIQKLLHELSMKYSLVSISNGNCNVIKLSIHPFFKKNYSPVLGYRAKPNSEMLLQAAQDFSIDIAQLLHIGDSFKDDGRAALNAEAQFFHFSPFLTESSKVDDFIKTTCQNLRVFLNRQETLVL